MVEDKVLKETLSSAARRTYLVGKLSRLEHLLYDADIIAKTLPQSLREQLDESDNSKALLMACFSQIGELSRTGWQTLITELTFYIQCSDCPEPLVKIGLEKEDEDLLEGLVILFQRLRFNSKRNIIKFIEAALAGQPCELKMTSNRKQTEIVFRHFFDDFGTEIVSN